MKRSRFSEEQIIGIFKEHEAGVSVADLYRKNGISDVIYKWESRLAGGLGGQAAEDAGGREHVARTIAGRRQAEQGSLGGSRGKEMATPAVKRMTVAPSPR